MIHYSWVIFSVIVVLLLIGIFKERRGGDYSFDLYTPFYMILLIAFVLVWGGIFWW